MLSPNFRLPYIHPRLTSLNPNSTIYSCWINKARVPMASNDTASSLEKEQIFSMAEKEMEYRVELFNKLTHTCFNKCVEKKYKESELNMGENSCIDRCVSKYWHVTNLVGQLLGSGRPGM
ncbi:hypothetical protein G4B88_026237 [Cannabis sativa]|uniref:Mitochondrial import inner membrane translocase subunit n=2 Tax=Cannabis sativa TaxID=3483 RepID=A0A7J6DTP3_CANSA|nr:hypothetical protein G4B88_026237 [Cannabis sativa]